MPVHKQPCSLEAFLVAPEIRNNVNRLKTATFSAIRTSLSYVLTVMFGRFLTAWQGQSGGLIILTHILLIFLPSVGTKKANV